MGHRENKRVEIAHKNKYILKISYISSSSKSSSGVRYDRLGVLISI